MLAHAIIDAMLGAAALGDIGQHFPDTDPALRGRGLDRAAARDRAARSRPTRLARRARRRDRDARAAEARAAPRGDHGGSPTRSGSRRGSVNVKATTGERMGFVGREEGVAAMAVATISLTDTEVSRPRSDVARLTPARAAGSPGPVASFNQGSDSHPWPRSRRTASSSSAAQDLYDRDGDKIGIDRGDLPRRRDRTSPNGRWSTPGMFGTKRSFVPLRDADEADGGLTVPFEKEQVKDAPKLEPNGQLSRREESELYAHYGIDYAARQRRRPRGCGAPTADAGRTSARAEAGRRRPPLQRARKRVPRIACARCSSPTCC